MVLQGYGLGCRVYRAQSFGFGDFGLKMLVHVSVMVRVGFFIATHTYKHACGHTSGCRFIYIYICIRERERDRESICIYVVDRLEAILSAPPR